jgi:3-oxoacyl-[acyl-carrier-protein] synthase III
MDDSNIHLLSAATVLPGPPLDNATLAKRLGMPAVWEQWVDTYVGTRTRHFVLDLETGKQRESLADIAASAASQALAGAGLTASDIDLVVMSTCSPDKLMPATVNMVAEQLGIDQVPAYQLQSGCTGAVQALDVARQMLLTGTHRTALVIGGDVCAKHADLTMNLAEIPPAQQVNAMLFGDGAGAAVLGAEPSPISVVLRRTLVRLVGLHRAPAQTVEWFGLADRHGDGPGGSEDYKAIEEHVPVMAAEVFQELLDDLNWKADEIDYLLPPQLSGRMTARIMERLDAPCAQEVSCVAQTGNTGNALPFFQLERVLARMAEGDRALGITIESSKWIKAGFALERV